MPHKELFTKAFMEALDAPKKPEDAASSKKHGDVTHVDTLEPGKALVLRVSYGGTKTWKVMYYTKTHDRNGKLRTTARATKLGHYPAINADRAYAMARKFEHKKAAAAASSDLFKTVAQKWLQECVDLPKLISRKEVRRHLETYVLPSWETRKIGDIDRDEVNALLDRIVDKKIWSKKRKMYIGGRTTADAVLATIRSVMLWYVGQSKSYVSPIERGMKLKRDRRRAAQKQRCRTLDDNEIRELWAACQVLGNNGALVQMLLLTAQRLRVVATMRWSDIDQDGLWTVRGNEGGKGNAGKVRLPQLARDILDAQPRIDGSDHVFPAVHGKGARNSFSGIKRAVHALMPEGTAHWVLHDLRRTARTRMAELDVKDHIAEITLGHKIIGIAGVYNRAELTDRKSDALRLLALHIAQVITPPPAGNVVPLVRAAAGARSTG